MMDALALLCNLHARGPVTLTRLRAAGVTLSRVAEMPLDGLLPLLDAPVDAAARFQREARILRGRIGADSPEEEGVGREEGALAPALAPAAASSPLQPGAVEGLDGALAAAFAREGVRTLGELARCAVGRHLALRLGTTLPRLIALQGRAGEALRADARDVLVPHAGAPATRIPSAAVPPPVAPPAVPNWVPPRMKPRGAGGPFAK